MQHDEILTIKELASYLKIAEKTAYRYVSEGIIPGFKIGGSWRFKRAEINDWIASKSQKDKNNES